MSEVSGEITVMNARPIAGNSICRPSPVVETEALHAYVSYLRIAVHPIHRSTTHAVDVLIEYGYAVMFVSIYYTY
jgi:hypothetical protein